MENLHARLLELLRRFHALATDHDLQYGIESGTLLGAVREERIIAHDDDVDVYVVKGRSSEPTRSTIDRVGGRYGLQAVSMVKEAKFLYLMSNFDGFKLLASEEGDIGGDDLDGRACIDVFIRSRVGPVYVNPGIFLCEYLDAEAVETPRVYRVGDQYVWGPSQAQKYLGRTYGNTWRTPIKYAPHSTHLRPTTMKHWPLPDTLDQKRLASLYERDSSALQDSHGEMPFPVRWLLYVVVIPAIVATVAAVLCFIAYTAHALLAPRNNSIVFTDSGR